MTFVVVVVFGLGVILIGSSLDNTPILATIVKILNGTALDWTGKAPSTTPPGETPPPKGKVTLV
jgi:hypothetical protein